MLVGAVLVVVCVTVPLWTMGSEMECHRGLVSMVVGPVEPRISRRECEIAARADRNVQDVEENLITLFFNGIFKRKKWHTFVGLLWPVQNGPVMPVSSILPTFAYVGTAKIALLKFFYSFLCKSFPFSCN